ncbi:MAG: hypothetical protein ABSA76_11830, partial [Bacteroidales bacterium]
PDLSGKDATNPVSFLILEAAHRLRIPANIGVCVGKDVDPRLIRRGVEILLEDRCGVPKFLGVDNTIQGFADNGFPLGVSLSMILYDSSTNTNLNTVDATDVLKAATVDANGKVTAPVSSATSITITRDFWKNVNTADKLIFRFSMNTTNSSSQDVKIYSDYKINFKAAMVLKPDIKVDLKKQKT